MTLAADVSRAGDHAQSSLRDRYVTIVTRVSVAAVVLATWQLLARNAHSIIPADAVSRPSAVAVAFWHIASSGALEQSFLRTALLLLVALVSSAPLGIALALLTLVKPIGWLLRPMIAVFYSIPKLALVPVFVLLFGIGAKSHVLSVVSVVVFVYFYSTEQALNQLDKRTVTSMRLMGASRSKVLRAYVLPAIVPEMIGATRVAIPLALTIEIFAELEITTGGPGLGVMLGRYMGSLQDTAYGMAVLLFIVLIAYLLDMGLDGVLRRYTRVVGQGERH